MTIMVDIESRAKARRITNERNLGALANDTKWSEFFVEVHEKALKLEIKFIDADVPTKEGKIWIPAKNYIEGIETGPELFVFIEWVRSSAIDEISKIAKLVGLEFIEIEGTVLVYGYK